MVHTNWTLDACERSPRRYTEAELHFGVSERVDTTVALSCDSDSKCKNRDAEKKQPVQGSHFVLLSISIVTTLEGGFRLGTSSFFGVRAFVGP
jgi:hypothetical protein